MITSQEWDRVQIIPGPACRFTEGKDPAVISNQNYEGDRAPVPAPTGEKAPMVIVNQSFDEERALYGMSELTLRQCRIDGPADGESAFKQCRDITCEDCFFNLRYPFWHDRHVRITGSEMTDLCRAALWYSEDVRIDHTAMHGIKALRECTDVTVADCDILSPEFGWMLRHVSMERCRLESQYMLMRSENLRFPHVDCVGKYSFQYVKNAEFDHCTFDTKDAFWHAENVVVRDSVVRGEYLAWYSDQVTFIRCRIIGTQPLCECRHLTLIDCTMEDTDLAFEGSDVTATVTTPIVSIKNPRSGLIAAPRVDAFIWDDPRAEGRVITGGVLHRRPEEVKP